jgi:hypothetical protein
MNGKQNTNRGNEEQRNPNLNSNLECLSRAGGLGRGAIREALLRLPAQQLHLFQEDEEEDTSVLEILREREREKWGRWILQSMSHGGKRKVEAWSSKN